MLTFIASMFALGLVTSVHCVSMCGPLIITYAVKGDDEGPWHRALRPHAAYHAARFASYATVGLLLGAVGSVFNLDIVRPYAMFAAGGLMVVLGLSMTGWFPWARRLVPGPPRFIVDAIRKTRRKAKADTEAGAETLATPATFGLLTGLMPCGPLIGAELTAAASGSALSGALGMLAFGVGTAPLLLIFGTGASLIPKRFKERMNIALAIVLVVFGLVFFDRALALVGSPVTFSAVREAVLGKPAATSGPSTGWKTAADGVVEVTVAYVDMEFLPRDVRIPANRQVRLIVDRRRDDAGPASKQIAIPQLHILSAVEDSATTPVDVPSTPAGTYRLTCGMGVMEGSLIVVASGNADVPRPATK